MKSKSFYKEELLITKFPGGDESGGSGGTGSGGSGSGSGSGEGGGKQ